jgi:steroid 5-alpha reductase family enzyme
MIIGMLSLNLVIDSFNLFVSTIIIDVIMTIIVFVSSIKYNNSSLYDPYWSVIPVFIVLMWMYVSGTFSVPVVVVLLGVLVWAIRLTSNWAINLKSYDYEDFRYQDFRAQFPKTYWLISFSAIHMFPTAIVLLALYPIYAVITGKILYVSLIFLGTFIMILGALISFYADNQLRSYKKQYPEESIKNGLWKYSRHPNYFGEVLFWVGVAVAGLSTGFGIDIVLGATAMWVLFNFYSVPKMEQKLLNNKPDYQQIIDEVPRFMFWKRGN